MDYATGVGAVRAGRLGMLLGLAVLVVLAGRFAATADADCPPAGVPDYLIEFQRGSVVVFGYSVFDRRDSVCDRRIGRVIRLKPYDRFVTLPITFAVGTSFAYVAGPGAEPTSGAFYIASIDLVSGRYTHRITFRAREGGVSNLIVKRNGSIAWIQYGSRKFRGPVVRLADQNGVRVPKHGHGVTSKLRLQGSRLTWRRGTTTFATTLR